MVNFICDFFTYLVKEYNKELCVDIQHFDDPRKRSKTFMVNVPLAGGKEFGYEFSVDVFLTMNTKEPKVHVGKEINKKFEEFKLLFEAFKKDNQL